MTQFVKADMRVIRRTLADGSVKEYRYPRITSAPKTGPLPGSVAALIRNYERSREWAILAPGTQSNYRRALAHLEGIARLPVVNVRRRTLRAMRDAIATTRGPAAANSAMQLWSTLFRWAVDREWIEHSPADKVRGIPGGHLLAWTWQEAERAERELPAPLARVVTLARFTGQRRGDLIRLTWGAYDGSAIRLTQGKTGVALVIPAHPTLRTHLDAWRAEAAAAAVPSLHILTNSRGRPWLPVSLSHAMGDAMTKLGMRPGLNVHGLRKLAAHSLAEAGCSTHQVASITGHRTLAMVQLYTAAADQEGMATAAIHRLEKGKNDGR